MELEKKDIDNLGTITKEKLIELIKAGDIDTVVIAFCDMQGRLMGKRVTGEFCLENDIAEGTHFCTYLLGTDFEMNVPEGYDYMNWGTGYGDWLAKPDWSTLKVVPWLEKTAIVLSDVHELEDEEQVTIAPRTVLQNQLKKAEDMGFKPFMASELEFFLFDDSFDEVSAKGYNNMNTAGHINEDYNLLQGTRNEPLYQKIRQYMQKMGIPIESSKGEASVGQHEINMKYSDPLQAADQHIMFKHGMKEICMQNGQSVTFMAKPYQEWTGSSGHVHLSLRDMKTGKNAFLAEDGDDNTMSELMKHFLAGVIKYTNDFSLFFAPYVNSYKRFAPNSWAPTTMGWSRDNRSAGYRTVGEGQSLRFESRIPGADMNPYLAYSAMIGAGLYGIENKLSLPKEVKGSAYTNEEVEKINPSLHKAITKWENSSVVKEVLGEDVAKHYLHAAKVEQDEYDSFVTTWERARYFEQC